MLFFELVGGDRFEIDGDKETGMLIKLSKPHRTKNGKVVRAIISETGKPIDVDLRQKVTKY